MICKGCFGTEKEAGKRCPDCGYMDGDVGKDAEAFMPGTILEGRFMIGNVIYANMESLTYKGYDRLLDQKILLRQKREHVIAEQFQEKAKWFAYFMEKEHILDIYDFREMSGSYFMIMRNVERKQSKFESVENFQSRQITVEPEDIWVTLENKFYIADFRISVPYKKKAEKKSPKIRLKKEKKHDWLPENTLLQGRYRILYPVGAGGFGVTYLALDHCLDREVAIKEYMPGEISFRAPNEKCVEVVSSAVIDIYKNGLKNFQREAVSMACFNGEKYTADIYDYFQENETAYIVMEYVEGENIGKFGRLIGGFSYEAAKDVFGKLLEALESIHKKGIIHEDVSPGNIILTKKNQLKIIDFGSAQLLGSGNETISQRMIKPGYAAPEQYDESYKACVQTDIYQAAATFYKLITGRKPPDASLRRQKDTILMPSELGIPIPGKDEKILKQALDILPKNRIASASELWKEIQ
jgi:RIO-like serine/threonine protein kinase